jgi:hypothetical protein
MGKNIVDLLVLKWLTSNDDIQQVEILTKLASLLGVINEDTVRSNSVLMKRAKILRQRMRMSIAKGERYDLSDTEQRLLSELDIIEIRLLHMIKDKIDIILPE